MTIPRKYKPVTILVESEDYQVLKRMAELKGKPEPFLLANAVKPIIGFWRMCLAVDAPGMELSDDQKAEI